MLTEPLTNNAGHILGNMRYGFDGSHSQGDGWLLIFGAVKGNPGPGAGGVIRGDKGEWIIGFSENLGYCSSVKAELRAVLHGLKLAKEANVHRIWVQLDSSVVVGMLKNQMHWHPEHA
uniref:RNase H type-1 domain-containing protein n=1 Tax=Opuntia streptacantha TaxID=393608 RepID=A0A7C8YVG9_OPUST